MPDTKISGDSPASDYMWRTRAACKALGYIFFGPDKESKFSRKIRERIAKQICDSCAVRKLCFEFAEKTRQNYGVWGGTTTAERRIATVGRESRDGLEL